MNDDRSDVRGLDQDADVPSLATIDAPAPVAVAAIAAGTGGLAAFKELLEVLPAETGLAFVLATAPGTPQRDSLAATLRCLTRMPVSIAGRGEGLAANRLLIVPQGGSCEATVSRLEAAVPVEGRARSAIDRLFESLAGAWRERAIGVVLAGSGSEGASGLARIKAAGGTTLAQRPDSAEQDAMPRAAIAAGAVDRVLAPRQLAEALAGWRPPHKGSGPADIGATASVGEATERFVPAGSSGSGGTPEERHPFSTGRGEAAGAQARRPGPAREDVDRQWQGLHESEAQLRLALEAAGLGTFRIDVASSIVHYSPELAAMLGFPAVTETRVEMAMQRVHRDDQARVMADYRRALDPGGTGELRMELRFVRPGGEVRWMTWNGRVEFCDRGGGRLPFRVLGACADITERREAEERLKESEARFRTLVGLSSDWYWEQDEEFRFISFSDPVEKLAGSSVTSHLGKRRWELPFVGVTEEQWAEHRVRLERHEPFRNLEYRRINEKGEIIWMLAHGDPIFDSAGRFKGYRGTGHNITERKEAEIALRESEERLRIAAKAANIGFWVHDLATETVRATPEFYRLLAMTPTQEPVSRHQIWSRFAPDVRERISDAMHASIRSGQQLAEDRELVLADGSVRWMSILGDTRLDAEGRPIARYGAVVDITQRKEAEARLRESEARFRLLADSSPVLIWVTGKDGGEFFNRPYVEFVGAQSEAELARMGWARFLHPEDHEPYVAAFLDCEARRVQFEAQVRLRRADGEYRWMKSIGVPRISGAGTYLGYVGSTLDITDMKRKEERIETLVRELDHRVKNILARFEAVIDRTADGAQSIEAFIGGLRTRVESMTRAHELLSMAHWSGASLADVVAVQLEAYATSRNLSIRGPPVLLNPDATQALSIVINELATNAAKYGALSRPEGRVSVTWHTGMRVDGARVLRLDWREGNGPAVEPPLRQSYGTSVICQMLGHEFEGSVDLRFEATGVTCSIDVPLAEIEART
jgi:PAS domain S-box-containing protein